jgi:hypothetical protein
MLLLQRAIKTFKTTYGYGSSKGSLSGIYDEFEVISLGFDEFERSFGDEVYPSRIGAEAVLRSDGLKGEEENEKGEMA